MSYNEGLSLENDSIFGTSGMGDSQEDEERRFEIALEQTTASLQQYFKIYEKIELENNKILENIGFTCNDIPADIKQDLCDIFRENEVFYFTDADSREAVIIDPCYVLDRLDTEGYLATAQNLKMRIDHLLDDLNKFQANIVQKYNSAECEAEMLMQKIAEYQTRIFNFAAKLETKKNEYDELTESYEKLEKSKYTLEELNELHARNKRLDEDIALAKVKLEKYHDLPLSVSDAARRLAKLKDELRIIDGEIQKASAKFD